MKVKESFYNTYIDIDNNWVIYNSYTDSYLLLSNTMYETFEINKKNIEEIKSDHRELYNMLLSKAFIVPSDTDETELLMAQRIRRRFTSTHYDLMINPTLECNLSCWYCYENHTSGLSMSPKVMANIIKHLQLKTVIDPFVSLSLSFFGGEPLLRSKTVVTPLIESIYRFTGKNKIDFSLNITTNGTNINYKLLRSIINIRTSFQITIDGDKKLHDKVRGFNNGTISSYDLIIKNIHKISEILSDYHIVLRINYNSDTLKNSRNIVDDLNFITPSHIEFNLVKIWQEDSNLIKVNDLLDLIEYIHNKGYHAEALSLIRKNDVCYADNLNQLLINYDGLIYKCTARDFNSVNSEGRLLDSGVILWKSNKLTERLYLNLPQICRKCNLLPSCPGICSQSILEDGEKDVKCIIDNMKLSKEEYIIHNFETSYFENLIHQ